jgi:hypothetical protein
MPDSTQATESGQTIAGQYCGQIQPHPAHVWETPRLFGSTTIKVPRQCAGTTGEVTPGPCWHGSGIRGADGRGASVRPAQLATRARTSADRGSWGGTAVWASDEPMADWEREILARTLSADESDAPTVCVRHGRFIPCRKDGEHAYTANPFWVKSVRDYQTSTIPGLTWEPDTSPIPPGRTGGDS